MSLPDTASLNEMKQAVRDNQMNKGEGKILLSQSKADLLSKMMRAGKIRDTHTVFGNNPNQGRVNTGSLMRGKDMASEQATQVASDLRAITMGALLNLGSDISQNIYSRTLAGRIEAGESIPYSEMETHFQDIDDEDFWNEVGESESGRLDFGNYNMRYFIKQLDKVTNYESDEEGYNSEGDIIYANDPDDEDKPRTTKALIDAIENQYYNRHDIDEYGGEVEELQGMIMEESMKDEKEYWEQIYDQSIKGKKFTNVTGMVDAFKSNYLND